MFLTKLFKRSYNLYAYNSGEQSKHMIQFFEKDQEAVYYLKKLLDSKIKDFCKETGNGKSLAEDYLNNRTHSYKIENCKFDEVEYIKNNADRIYKECQSTQ